MSKNQRLYPPTMTVDCSALPNDIDVLKNIVCGYAAVIEHQAITISDQAKTIADQMVAISVLTARVSQLEERYDKLARLHFGQSSEKLSTLKTAPESPSDPLTDVPSDGQKTEETADTKGTDLKKKQKKQDHVITTMAATHLRRIYHVIQLNTIFPHTKKYVRHAVPF